MSNQIDRYMHCPKCLREKPSTVSPENYARLSVGLTKTGFSIRCVRHGIEVIHFTPGELAELVKHPPGCSCCS